jgi:hypothetical protein
MKPMKAVRTTLVAVVCICMLACIPAAALANGAPAHRVSQPAAPTATDPVSNPSSPFAVKDLMVLGVGATALVAFGVGFRRVSASFE